MKGVALPQFDASDPGRFSRWQRSRVERIRLWKEQRRAALLKQSQENAGMLSPPLPEDVFDTAFDCMDAKCSKLTGDAFRECKASCERRAEAAYKDPDYVDIADVEQYPRTDLVVSFVISMPETKVNGTQQWKDEFRNASVGSF